MPGDTDTGTDAKVFLLVEALHATIEECSRLTT